jgi:hypothetical protein
MAVAHNMCYSASTEYILCLFLQPSFTHILFRHQNHLCTFVDLFDAGRHFAHLPQHTPSVWYHAPQSMTSHHHSDPSAHPQGPGGRDVLQDPVSLEPEHTVYDDSSNPLAHSNDDFEHGEHPDDYDNTTQPKSDDNDAPNTSDSQTEHDYAGIVSLMNSPSYSQDQKHTFLDNHTTNQLDRYYAAHMNACGLRRFTRSYTIPSATDNITEDNYLPLDPNDGASPYPHAPPPLYPAYTGHFRTAQAASTYRKRTRVAPKSNAPDVERVKRYGRTYLWLQQ